MGDAFSHWLEVSQAWQVGLVLVLAMLVASALGEWLNRRTAKAKATTEGKEEGGNEGYIVSATLGLLALLMGFTFSLAVDRYEARRMLVLEEANAIGTTYLRTQMLEPVDRARISKMLVDYTDNRLALATAPRDKIEPLLVKNDQMLTDLWTATLAAWPSIKGMDFSSSYLETMNNMIDLDSARKAARLARVPSTVFFVLFIYVITSAGVLGYAGANKEGRGATTFLFLLLAISLLLTLDIDRPASGRVTESQAPMERLRDTLKSQPPQVFDRMSTGAPTPAAPPKGEAAAPGN
jgi:membrane protease YdiL (CAAX protease family)